MKIYKIKRIKLSYREIQSPAASRRILFTFNVSSPIYVSYFSTGNARPVDLSNFLSKLLFSVFVIQCVEYILPWNARRKLLARFNKIVASTSHSDSRGKKIFFII